MAPMSSNWTYISVVQPTKRGACIVHVRVMSESFLPPLVSLAHLGHAITNGPTNRQDQGRVLVQRYLPPRPPARGARRFHLCL